MDNVHELNVLVVALKLYAQRTHRVNMFQIINQLTGVLEDQGYTFADIVRGLGDYAKSERDRNQRINEEDKEQAWGTVASLLLATAQEAEGENLP